MSSRTRRLRLESLASSVSSSAQGSAADGSAASGSSKRYSWPWLALARRRRYLWARFLQIACVQVRAALECRKRTGLTCIASPRPLSPSRIHESPKLGLPLAWRKQLCCEQSMTMPALSAPLGAAPERTSRGGPFGTQPTLERGFLFCVRKPSMICSTLRPRSRARSSAATRMGRTARGNSSVASAAAQTTLSTVCDLVSWTAGGSGAGAPDWPA